MSLPTATPSSTGTAAADDELMVRVQADDTAAFRVLFDRHYARAIAVALSVCHDRGRAEDAVQEGFLKVWRSRAGFQPARGSFRGWSMTMIHHRAIDSVRAEASARRPRLHSPERLDTIAAPGSVPAEVIDKSQGDALRGSLRDLPAAQAEVISLAFYGGLSHSEIATQLELPHGTVKGRIRLGLEKLRDAVEPTSNDTD